MHQQAKQAKAWQRSTLVGVNLTILDPTIVLFVLFVCFDHQKLKKNHPQKLLRIPQIHFFSLTALTAETAQTEEFMFQNVAY